MIADFSCLTCRTPIETFEDFIDHPAGCDPEAARRNQFEESRRFRAALEEIRRLHAPRIMPDGEMWCDLCCFDESGHQTEDCAESHDHQPGRAACSTAEIIARAGL